ncbi:MAG: hypothetical protein H6540_05095 [Bacteroidales bacterium]|nr:hypothetical protein [Bacteroidales bacterium]
MKKIIVFLLVCALSVPFLSAQESMFGVGDKVVNLGIGLGSTLYSGTYYKSSVPPVSFSFEKGIKDGVLDKGVIGVGAYLGYSAYKWEYLGYGWKYSNLIIGARGSFHYPLVDKLDTYAGVLLGYNIATSKEFGTTIGVDPYSGGGLVLSGYIGGRYYFNDKFAAMAELGYGISYLNLGLAIKL